MGHTPDDLAWTLVPLAAGGDAPCDDDWDHVPPALRRDPDPVVFTILADLGDWSESGGQARQN
ncbi:MAG: hypothetical protein QM733_01175 [Ilumatobacteraceae bacterium]